YVFPLTRLIFSMTFQVKILVFLLALASVAVVLEFFYVTDWIQLKVQNSCKCEKCFSKEDVFLNQHLNSSIEPFLSASTNLSEEDFIWWKHLQSNRHNFSYYKATVDKLFKIISPRPIFEKPRTDGCRTCAVVGNSVNLKGSHYGPLIDFQDFIIRINHGRVKGYEEDVGTRTTHRIMYPESGSTLDNTTHLVMFAFKMRDIEWLIRSFPTGSSGKYPSTGFMTLIFALHICDEVWFSFVSLVKCLVSKFSDVENIIKVQLSSNITFIQFRQASDSKGRILWL
uniref:ST3 beta-galactoside alpha-2,3-sialyltransferase 1 n=1 Tax=Fundulus heteroclitus TaxID=8078 RepID=A0A3Q2P9D2_FUNHE